MRKSEEQMTALILTVRTTVAGSMTGYAGLVVKPSDAAMNRTQVTNDGGDSVSEPIGQIDAAPLDVTPLLRAGFNIGPTTYAESNITTQVGERQSKEYKITNDSAIPIYAYISAAGMNKDKDGNPYMGGVTDMSLVTTKEGFATAHSIILAVKGAIISMARVKPDTGDTGFWLEEEAAADDYKYILSSNKGKIDAKSGANRTMMSLKVCGLTQTGWNHQDKFVATPIFMVATTAPQISQGI